MRRIWNILWPNLPLIANIAVNCLGIFMIYLIQGDLPQRVSEETRQLADTVGHLFDVITFGVGSAILIYYELPIRRCLALGDPQLAPQEQLETARRRLLNQPYAYMTWDLTSWGVAAVIFPSLLYFTGAPTAMAIRVAGQAGIIGLITSTLAFFVVEFLLQTFYMKRFFPNGGVFAVQGVMRTRIATRILALVVIAGLIPCLVSLLVVSGTDRLVEAGLLPPAEIFRYTQDSIRTNVLIFGAVGLAMALLVRLTLVRPLMSIANALERVAQGQLNQRLWVRSTDELGYACEVINHMTQGLKERERMAHGLSLAGEMQRGLLPQCPPAVEGLEVAGVSLPCDETGGDYFDYIPAPEGGVIVLVGDVSGHGVPSALLMTTVRALARMRMALPGDYQDRLRDINRQLCQDVGNSGNFMTLFGLGYDPATREMAWVRAGHDPALLFDPASGDIRELSEGGPALGVMPEAVYAQGRDILKPGQVVLLGTDGIWETRSPDGEMFGKVRTREVLATRACLPAQGILEALLAEVTAFRGHSRAADDITAVVIKAV